MAERIGPTGRKEKEQKWYNPFSWNSRRWAVAGVGILAFVALT